MLQNPLTNVCKHLRGFFIDTIFRTNSTCGHWVDDIRHSVVMMLLQASGKFSKKSKHTVLQTVLQHSFLNYISIIIYLFWDDFKINVASIVDLVLYLKALNKHIPFEHNAICKRKDIILQFRLKMRKIPFCSN